MHGHGLHHDIDSNIYADTEAYADERAPEAAPRVYPAETLREELQRFAAATQDIAIDATLLSEVLEAVRRRCAAAYNAEQALIAAGAHATVRMLIGDEIRAYEDALECIYRAKIAFGRRSEFVMEQATKGVVAVQERNLHLAEVVAKHR